MQKVTNVLEHETVGNARLRMLFIQPGCMYIAVYGVSGISSNSNEPRFLIISASHYDSSVYNKVIEVIR